MLAKIGFWLLSASFLGTVTIWSFFPSFGAAKWPYYVLLTLMPLGLLLWIFFSLGRLSLWFRKRSTQYAMSLLLMAASCMVLIGFLNWGSVQLTERKDFKKDYTKEKLYTLSDQTVSLLKKLNEPIKLEVWTVEISSLGTGRDMKAFFDSYQSKSNGQLKLEVINPQAKYLEAQKNNIRRNNIIIVKALGSGREVRIENFDEKKGEEQITNAIMNAIRGQKKVVCFLGGYGGLSIEDKGPEGCSFLKEALASASYEPKEIALNTLETIPAECEMLALVGPRAAPNERDVQMIRDAVAKGVPLLAMMGAQTAKSWKELTKDYGATVRDDLVLNPMRPNSRQVVDTANYARDVEIVNNFRLRTTHFAVSSLNLPIQAKNGETIIKAFVSTDGRTYAKKIDLAKSKTIDLRPSPSDLVGALPLAALIERELPTQTAPNPTPESKPKAPAPKAPSAPSATEAPKSSKLDRLMNAIVPSAHAQDSDPHAGLDFHEATDEAKGSDPGKKMVRIVLFGSDLFVSNALIEEGGNRDLVLNSISYLLRDTNSLGIRPREIKDVRLAVGPHDARKVFGTLFLLSLVFLFLAARAAGRKARLKEAHGI